MIATMLFGELKVCINRILRLQLETNVLIGTAEGAFIIGTSDRHLKDDCVRLAGRSDDIPYIVHIKLLQAAGFFASKSFINSTSFTTPSTGKALENQLLRDRIREMADAAEEQAEKDAEAIIQTGLDKMISSMEFEIERLISLARTNPAVKREEIEVLVKEKEELQNAISDAHVRLDAVRLILPAG